MAMVRLPEQDHRAAHRCLGLTTIPEVQDLVPSSLHGRLQRERGSSERTRRAINSPPEEEFGKIVLRVDKAPHQPDPHQDISQLREICSVPATVPRWPKRVRARATPQTPPRIGKFLIKLTSLRLSLLAPGDHPSRTCCFLGGVCLLNEQRHWHLQIKTRGSRLGSL